MNPAAKFLGLLGLVLMACGGLFYAISLRHDAYGLYGAGAGLLLILISAVISRAKLADVFSRRSSRLGLGAGAGVLVVLAVVVFLGSLAIRHNTRWDISSDKAHSLALQSVQVVKGLKQPVEAIAFMRDNQAGRFQMEDLLDQYAFHSRMFKFRFVDPDQSPGLARRYQITDYGTLVLIAGDREERVTLPEEQSLTNALIRLTRGSKKTIYFVGGHGERSIQGIAKDDVSTLSKALEQGSFVVKDLLLATSPRVPADASVVILAGPQKPLMDVEKERLAAYLAGGGGLLIMIDPQTNAGLTDWLKERYILLGDDMVLDQASRLFNASPAWPLALEYGDHQITAPLDGMTCIFPMARSVRVAAALPPGVTGVELIKSSNQSWAESDLEALMAEAGAKYDEGKDRLGPVSLAAAVSLPGQAAKKDGDQPDAPAKALQGHLVVFGDVDFVSNSNLDLTSNRDLALNTINYLAQEEDLVAITPKKQASQPLLLKPEQARLIFWLPVVILPGILVILGVIVVIRRRRLA